MKRFYWPVTPKADPANCVLMDQCRITVLTPNLLRLEYSPSGQFADLASQMAFHRDFPCCTYDSYVENGILTVQTEALKLNWCVNSPFAADTLSVKLLCEPASTWFFGEDFEDLGGTAETLDGVDGRFPVGRGVCSRNGFSVLDDSATLLLDDEGDIVIREDGSVDCYFFGYGFDYIRAVQDLYRLTGVPPLLPAYALGNWWSRYYAYTQQEYLDLMDKFRREDIPFTVSVVDMDWHITKIPEDLKVQEESTQLSHLQKGWTGYTWNKELFPDYKQFLKDLHERNLKTTLNLHPAAGICPHESMYPQMANLCGIDPASKQRIPLNILSMEFMEKYFDILHHPYEEDGVDFWWMDWQQGADYWWIHKPNQPGEYADPRERMQPLWLLNHLHILDIARDGRKRPMFFSRFSGPGSHRYPVGFSGDTFVSWDSLKFQPEFTATASNIGYSWWSHDIGGHLHGISDHELYLRWIQLGVFSPINRLHSTKDPFMFKEPFMFPEPINSIASRYLRLRHNLFPYLYTMNYRNHTQLLPLVQPMYYTHPKCSAAYEVPTQFWFGSELIVAPITEKNDVASGLGCSNVWLPKGDWFDFFSGLRYASLKGRKLEVFRSLEDVPVFAKAGAIVPMANFAAHDNRLFNSENMTLSVFPGASNCFQLYEDANEGNDYASGAFVTTDIRLVWGKKPVLEILPAQGDTKLIPAKRNWRICLRGFHKDITLSASINGCNIATETIFDAATNSHLVSVEVSTTDTVRIEVNGDQLICDNSDIMDRCHALIGRSQLPFKEKQQLWEHLTSDHSIKFKRMQIVDIICSGYTAKGLMELLSLTEDPYTGNQLQ